MERRARLAAKIFMTVNAMTWTCLIFLLMYLLILLLMLLLLISLIRTTEADEGNEETRMEMHVLRIFFVDRPVSVATDSDEVTTSSMLRLSMMKIRRKINRGNEPIY